MDYPSSPDLGMTPLPLPPTPYERARKRGRRIVYVLFGAFATVFVVACIVEIIGTAIWGFRLDGRPSPERVSRPCAQRLVALAEAMDRAATTGLDGRDLESATEDTALSRFRGALGADWGDLTTVGRVCGKEGAGADALAALLRLKQAQEGLLRRQVVEIAPLRRDVSAYLAR